MTDPDIPTAAIDEEASRIRSVYSARDSEIPWDRYSVVNPGELFMQQQRVREVVRLLARGGHFPLGDVRILDVGCGHGGWLVDFDSWGATQQLLAGIDLDQSRLDHARGRLPRADLRQGQGGVLPWSDGSFDLVLQSTVFTSILDGDLRATLAAEMARVLAPDGAILWYDFFRDNPRNADVRGVKADAIQALFPGFTVALHRITLAPPISRRLAPVTWIGAMMLERIRLLNTHYIGLLRRSYVAR